MDGPSPQSGRALARGAQKLKFALSYFELGLQILIRNEDVSLFKIVLNLIFSPKFLWFMVSFALLKLIENGRYAAIYQYWFGN